MDIERFHILTEPQKVYYTKKMGVHLCTIQDAQSMIHLFAIDNYYVEINFSLRNFEDHYTRAFTSLANLEPYLEAINIESLFQ